MQPDRDCLRVAALLGFLAIGLGAVGAHGALHDRMAAAGELEHWRTAWSYHLPHAIVLAGLSFVHGAGGKWLLWSWRCLLAGVLLFSGSLYLLAYSQQAWLAHVTPLGGLSLMLGWLFLALAHWPRA